MGHDKYDLSDIVFSHWLWLILINTQFLLMEDPLF